MKIERRKSASHEAADRFTKQLIIWTLCLIAGVFAATVCWLCIRGSAIPDALDRLITFIVGNLTGMLAKTGIDAALVGPTPVTNVPGETLKTETAATTPPEGEPQETTE